MPSIYRCGPPQKMPAFPTESICFSYNMKARRRTNDPAPPILILVHMSKTQRKEQTTLKQQLDSNFRNNSDRRTLLFVYFARALSHVEPVNLKYSQPPDEKTHVGDFIVEISETSFQKLISLNGYNSTNLALKRRTERRKDDMTCKRPCH